MIMSYILTFLEPSFFSDSLGTGLSVDTIIDRLITPGMGRSGKSIKKI